MLGIQSITTILFGHIPSISDEVEVEYADLLYPDTPDINDVLEPGMIIWIETSAYGWQQGVVEFIDTSPFYGEDFDRAYVTALDGADQWADYVAAGEFYLFNPLGA